VGLARGSIVPMRRDRQRPTPASPAEGGRQLLTASRDRGLAGA